MERYGDNPQWNCQPATFDVRRSNQRNVTDAIHTDDPSNFVGELGTNHNDCFPVSGGFNLDPNGASRDRATATSIFPSNNAGCHIGAREQMEAPKAPNSLQQEQGQQPELAHQQADQTQEETFPVDELQQPPQIQSLGSLDPSAFISGSLPQGYLELTPTAIAPFVPASTQVSLTLPTGHLMQTWPTFPLPQGDQGTMSPLLPTPLQPQAPLGPGLFQPGAGNLLLAQVVIPPFVPLAVAHPPLDPTAASMLIPPPAAVPSVDHNTMTLAQIRMMQSFQQQSSFHRLALRTPPSPVAIPQVASSPDRRQIRRRRRPSAAANSPKATSGEEKDEAAAEEQSDVSRLLSQVPKPSGRRHAYNYFFQEEKERLKAEWREQNRQFGFGTLSAEVGRRWKSLKRSDRVKYEILAEQDSIRYQKEKEACNQIKEEILAPTVQITEEQYQEYVDQHQKRKKKKKPPRRRRTT